MRPALARDLAHLRASVFADLAPAIAARRAAGLPLVPLHLGDTHRAPAATLDDLPAWARDSTSYAYGALGGVPALRDRIGETLTTSHGLASNGGDVFASVGATHGLLCAARACLDAGDEVVVLGPYWPLSVGVLRCAGAVPVEVPFTSVVAREGEDAALESVRRAIGSRTRALYFASPNNPCGFVYAGPLLERLVAMAAQLGLWVFADEVYAAYAYDAPFVSAGTLGDGQVVVVGSFSKSHGLAGARIGYVRAHPEVLAAAGKVATHSAFHPSIHAQGLAFAALANASWVADARAQYIDARDLVAGALERVRVPFLEPCGGSYVFADFAAHAGTAGVGALFERFVEAGVLVCPGAACGDAFGTYARLCFTGAPIEDLAFAMQALTGVLRG